jgi:ribosome-associated toxin RatA of RatAB toxin-antitoxin module
VATVRRSALLPYPPAALFHIVNDVTRYPEFLPWCSAARIVEEGPGEMIAALSLSASGFSETFTTRNRLTPFERIDMHLVSGPFRRLSGGWTFTALGSDQGCRVELSLDFQPRGMGRVLGGAFSRGADQLVDAFCSRANELLTAGGRDG